LIADLAPPAPGRYRQGMIGRLNHVGVATPSISEAVATWRELLGADAVRPPFDMVEQGVRVCFIDLPNSQIELIEPLGETSPLHGFLSRNPRGGQHHLCFEVDDIFAARDDLAAKGATVLNGGQPRMGAHGVPVIFVRPADMGGVLIELMAKPEGAH
jgi:methylmalonyl-CoA/ethylmalonyl-CoA epimerase